MPCKKGTKKLSSFQETEAKSDASNRFQRQKHACIVEAHESTRQRLESSPRKIMKITSQANDIIRWHISIWCTRLHAASDENSVRESCSGQGIEECRNDSSLAVGQN